MRLTPVPIAITIYLDITAPALRVPITISLVFCSNSLLKRLGPSTFLA